MASRAIFHSMASIAAARPHLRELQEVAHQAEKALEIAEGAEGALILRAERRRRREWDDYDSEDEEDDEDSGDGDDDFAEEEEEGFDFDAKREQFAQEILRLKKEATDAYMAFVMKFEASVKADSVGPLKKLHEKMHAKLPVELRDMIYSYLNIQAPPYANDPTKHHPICYYRNEFDPNFHSHTEIAIDDDLRVARRCIENGSADIIELGGWLVNPEYVGPGMAREVAEIFYRVNDFSIQAKYLEKLLTEDRTRTGLKPYEHIRGKVNVSIMTTRCNGSNEQAWQNTENEVAFLNGIYAQLRNLMLLTRKSEISLSLGLSTSAPLWEDAEEGERRFYNIMESVRAPIYDLKHAGVNIDISHTAASSLRSKSISEEPLNYFRLSREEWEAEKSNHGADWVPSMNFILREDLENRDKDIRENTKRQLREALEERWGHVNSIDAYGQTD